MAKNEKKGGAFKAIAIILASFLLVPALTLVIVYYSNVNFQYTVNRFLSGAPGVIGNYFERIPTKEEQELLKRQIAENYITLEEDRLIDKLLLIRSEDNKLFNDLIIILNDLNSRKMTKVSEGIRRSDLKGSSLDRVLEEIDLDKEKEIIQLVDYYTAMKVSDTVMEISADLNNGELTLETLPQLFSKFSVDTAAKYIMYSEEELSNKILFNLPAPNKQEIEIEIERIMQSLQQSREMAEIYGIKTTEELLTLIGNTDKHKIQELVNIYGYLPSQKGGQVLSKVSDEELTLTIIEGLVELEKLGQTPKGKSKNLSTAIQVYKNYDLKIQELVEIYQKLPIENLATLVDQMLSTNSTYQINQLIDEDDIVFTQEQLIIDVLRQLKPTLIADLIEQLRTQRAIELTQKYVGN
ncbi:hypothetical protein [Alkaliphilus serpentinus]|uniref:Flagellar motor switch protein FliG n=1 Tax=Alkaliphilus serpentinus TaxID=1482731 RepID=A0A833MEI2_9FIRM|nr:hypothetical protein [Alkaliphilus serpentinus]KAB3531384.1 hypothetical protein F8153_04175 [Alkaliphilus serpentinus]